MKLIKLETTLFQYDTLQEYLADMPFQVDDLLITAAILHEQYQTCITAGVLTINVDQYSHEEPTDVMVEAILRDIASTPVKRIIALGGGACMDIAKVLAITLDSDEKTIDWIFTPGPDLVRKPELVLIPTTCGTGSEVTSIAAINRTRIQTKVGIGAPALYGDKAILIPQLVQSLPQKGFATSSIDAFVHATESYLSGHATAMSQIFSEQAIRLILSGFRAIVENGFASTLPERAGDFMLASTYAGIAFETGGCAAVHALSYPLGAKYHIAHGESNYLVFSGVMDAYEAIDPQGRLRNLKQIIAEELNCKEADALEYVYALFDAVLVKAPLTEYGFVQEDVAEFAASVIMNQQRLLRNNYVPLSQLQIEAIYQGLFDGGK